MTRILVVEDDTNTSDMLRRYFEIVGYEVLNALNGSDAIKFAQEHKPSVIILDIMLPDMDGYEVCRRLRALPETDQIPVIFLTQKDDRRDRLSGLSLGADDYITKPFDIDELRLRVHNIIGRMGGETLVDARTGLPRAALIKERLPRLLEDPNSIYFETRIEGFDAFSKQYGPVAANQVIRTTAKIIADLLHQLDPVDSFIGHPGDENFLIALNERFAGRFMEELPERFVKKMKSFYTDGDEVETGEVRTGLMTLLISKVESDTVRLNF